MKTKTDIRNMKSVAATIITALIFTLGVYSQDEVKDTTVKSDKPIYLVHDDIYKYAWPRKFDRNNRDSNIVVGYYETTKTTVWIKIRKIFTSRPMVKKSPPKVTGTAYIFM